MLSVTLAFLKYILEYVRIGMLQQYFDIKETFLYEYAIMYVFQAKLHLTVEPLFFVQKREGMSIFVET